MTKNSFTKLSDGSWGVRVNGDVVVGSTVKVTKKDGKVKSEKILEIISSENNTHVCRISPALTNVQAWDFFA